MVSDITPPVEQHRPSGPVRGVDRHHVVDGLRGCALLGIVVVNVEFILQHSDIGWSEHTSALDLAARWAIIAFGQLKIYPIFALLFGYGLSVQLSRSASVSNGLGRRYARRMAGLVVLGALHGILFFPGDILLLYGVVGAACYPLRRLSSTALLAIAATVYAAASAVWLTVAIALLVEPVQLAGEVSATELAAYASGNVGDVLAQHVGAWPETAGFLFVVQGPAVCAFFLIGVVLGRTDVLRNPRAHALRLRRVALTCAILGTAVAGIGAALALFGGVAAPVGLAAGLVAAPVLACAYVAALALLLSARKVRGSGLLRSSGRMSLSVYLAQSVVLTTLAYGYGGGLFGHLGPVSGVVLAVCVWAALAGCSVLWLRYARFGPAEWALRSLSYARVQPLRREH
ncbi:MAG: DUF418 domain-containing protein [Ornithinimicrobium sp.]